MKIKQLGNGSAFNHEMTNSSFLIENNYKYLLFDCTQYMLNYVDRMKQARLTYGTKLCIRRSYGRRAIQLRLTDNLERINMSAFINFLFGESKPTTSPVQDEERKPTNGFPLNVWIPTAQLPFQKQVLKLPTKYVLADRDTWHGKVKYTILSTEEACVERAKRIIKENIEEKVREFKPTKEPTNIIELRRLKDKLDAEAELAGNDTIANTDFTLVYTKHKVSLEENIGLQYYYETLKDKDVLPLSVTALEHLDRLNYYTPIKFRNSKGVIHVMEKKSDRDSNNGTRSVVIDVNGRSIYYYGNSIYYHDSNSKTNTTNNLMIEVDDATLEQS